MPEHCGVNRSRYHPEPRTAEAPHKGGPRKLSLLQRRPTLPGTALPVLGLPRPVLYREVLTLAADYDHVVLDGPPQVADVTPLSGHGQ